jgi:hypothetical protein
LPPALLLAPLFALIASQLFYALWPYSKRNYAGVLALTAAGFAVGQLWQYLGLPSFHLGEANLLPALVFAAALQPLAPRVPIHFRWPETFRGP